MEKKIFYLFAFLFCINSIVLGQKNTFIGIGGALTFDKYEFTDPGNVIRPIPLPSGSWGILIGQEINDLFLFETGIIRKYYDEGFGFNIASPVIGFSSNSFETIQLPIRLKTKFNIFRDKLFLTPIMGINLSINTEYGYGLGYGIGSSYIDSNDTYYLANYTEDVNKSQFFPLIETGLAIDFKIIRDIYLSTQFSYFGGLTKVSQIDYEYWVNNGETNYAFAHSNGSYFSFGLGINYRLSNIFGKN